MERSGLIPRSHFHQKLLDPTSFEGAYGELLRQLDHPKAHSRCVHLLEGLWLQLLEEAQEDRRGDSHQENIRELLHRIDERPLQDWDFHREAQGLHLSQVHFRRLFQNQAGQSPGRYLLERRMREAARLLAEPELKISQIADKLGYGAPHHFTRAFRRQMGLSPLQFRRASLFHRPSRPDSPNPSA